MEEVLFQASLEFTYLDNSEAFKAAFLEARQYVLENQVDLDKNWIRKYDWSVQARKIREEERGEADGEETPDSDGQTIKEKKEEVEVKPDEAGDETKAKEEVIVSKIADLAV